MTNTQTPALETGAERASLGSYLESVLEPEQRSNVLLISFSQWDFTLGALADSALCLRDIDAEVTLALWSGSTPLHDVGWTSSWPIASLLRSPARDQRVLSALFKAGVSKDSAASPPIARWRPVAPVQLPEVLNRTSIRAMKYRGSDVGRAILQVHPNRETPITDAFIWPKRWVNATARSYAYVFDQTSALIEQRGISAVIVYNGRFLHDRAAADAGLAAGLPVLSYDIGGGETNFDLTIDSTHDWSALQQRMLTMYETWPEAERDTLGSSWFLERTNHEDVTNALFVESQEIGTGIDAPDTDCLVAYFSSSGDEIIELDLDWTEFFGGQANALKLLAEQCRARPGYTLVVRSHPHKRMKPKEDVAEWLEAVGEANPDIHLDPFSPIDSYALMRQADIVVTYGSTTGVEAAFAGKPVIVMGPSAYDELGCARRVTTALELSNALDTREPGEWSGAVAYGLMMKRRGFRYRHVQSGPDGTRTLEGIPLIESRPIVLHLSHLLGRLQRWYLTR